MEFVQVRLLTNMSDPFPKKIVRERLTGSSAFYGERLRDIVLGERDALSGVNARPVCTIQTFLYSIQFFGRGCGGDFFSKKSFPRKNQS